MDEIIKQTQPIDTLIMDEADYLVFDDLCKTKADIPKCHKLIGLTATSFQREGGLEQAWLKKNGIATIESIWPEPDNERIECAVPDDLL